MAVIDFNCVWCSVPLNFNHKLLCGKCHDILSYMAKPVNNSQHKNVFKRGLHRFRFTLNTVLMVEGLMTVEVVIQRNSFSDMNPSLLASKSLEIKSKIRI